MNLFEYQGKQYSVRYGKGKQYFVRYGIPVPAGDVADTAAEAVAHADAVGYPVVVKAPDQVGGRGKAGCIWFLHGGSARKRL